MERTWTVSGAVYICSLSMLQYFGDGGTRWPLTALLSPVTAIASAL